MCIKRKKGVVLIEVNIFLMIILVLFSASTKIFTRNIEKSQYLYSREDIKTISYLEYEFLQEFNKFVLQKKGEYQEVKDKGEDKTIDFLIYNNEIYKKYSIIFNNETYKNYSILFNNEKFYIIHKNSNSTKYIGIDEHIEGDLIYFKPNNYKTDYIIG